MICSIYMMVVQTTAPSEQQSQQPSMCDKLYSVISNCGESSRQNIKKFLEELFQSTPKAVGGQRGKLQELFLRLTRDFSVSRIREASRSERSKKDLTNYQFNYGEITFNTIHSILLRLQQHRPLGTEEIFYDLGSGSGKVLFAASLCHSFRKCVGIQYLQSLFQISMELRDRIRAEAESIEQEVNDIVNENYAIPEIEIYNANFEQFDWSNGTVIFVSSTCYTRDVMTTISALCDKLKPGTVLITLTRPLDTKNGWTVIQKFQGETSWGACTVFIHRRQP